MMVKASDFLSQQGRTLKKKRRSSLLKIFPLETFLEILTEDNYEDLGGRYGNGKALQLGEPSIDE